VADIAAAMPQVLAQVLAQVLQLLLWASE